MNYRTTAPVLFAVIVDRSTYPSTYFQWDVRMYDRRCMLMNVRRGYIIIIIIFNTYDAAITMVRTNGSLTKANNCY